MKQAFRICRRIADRSRVAVTQTHSLKTPLPSTLNSICKRPETAKMLFPVWNVRTPRPISGSRFITLAATVFVEFTSCYRQTNRRADRPFRSNRRSAFRPKVHLIKTEDQRTDLAVYSFNTAFLASISPASRNSADGNASIPTRTAISSSADYLRSETKKTGPGHDLKLPTLSDLYTASWH